MNNKGLIEEKLKQKKWCHKPVCPHSWSVLFFLSECTTHGKKCRYDEHGKFM